MSDHIVMVCAMDFLGVLLMVMMATCNRLRLGGRTSEDCFLRALVVCVIIGASMDAVATVYDGAPGAASAAALVFSETLLHVAEMAVCYCWSAFIYLHMRGALTQRARCLLAAPAAFCIALFAVNLFTPVVFYLDAANVYVRLPLAWSWAIVSYSYIVYALVVYVRMRKRGGLRFFPGWALMIPVVAGGTVQIAVPSVPLFWSTLAIGVASTLASLQNEDIYRDRLTGLYNRAFLEYVSSGRMKRAASEMTGIMIDLNGFKSINDRFGHTVGDQAIVDTAHLLRAAAGDAGIAVRYAGDEFVVLLNTSDKAVVDRTMADIRRGFQDFNDVDERPYRLSVSMGRYLLVPGDKSVNEFIAALDRALYEDKRRYYEEHPEADRRLV